MSLSLRPQRRFAHHILGFGKSKSAWKTLILFGAKGAEGYQDGKGRLSPFFAVLQGHYSLIPQMLGAQIYQNPNRGGR
jgi:hypothetical protein